MPYPRPALRNSASAVPMWPEKMPALDRNLALVRPGTAEVSRPPRHDGAGVTEDEELGKFALRQPFSVLFDDRRHVGRLSLDRDFARPNQRRQPCVALEMGRSIGG